MRKKSSGFTLVELVLVIVILAVLSAVSMPRFVALRIQARDNSDKYTMGLLNTALKTKFVENIANGQTPANAWPTQTDVFGLMEKPPAYQVVASTAFDSQDNVNWRLVANSGGFTVILCPHCTAEVTNTTITVVSWGKGKIWVYFPTGGFLTIDHSPGELYLYSDQVH